MRRNDTFETQRWRWDVRMRPVTDAAPSSEAWAGVNQKGTEKNMHLFCV
jgi:hypothetical protein